MRVFLSWSGARSQMVAASLRDWLPKVVKRVEPWLAAEDLPEGAQWATSIFQALEESDVGIACITQDNLNAAWLAFEAGALANSVDRLFLYSLDVAPDAIAGPLSQFQVIEGSRRGTWDLVCWINDLQVKPRHRDRINHAFALWWGELEARLSEVPAYAAPAPPSEGNASDKLDEVLSILRERTLPNLPVGLATSRRLPAGRPRVFIGSSAEGLSVAEALQAGLDHVTDCTVWTQGVFELSSTGIESIVDASAQFDFAVIVLTPDDIVTKRGESGAAPRDNLIFELGLFTGALGRARTFFVHPRTPEVMLPSDLAGVTAATYAVQSDGNLSASLGAVCTRIKKAMGV